MNKKAPNLLKYILNHQLQYLVLFAVAVAAISYWVDKTNKAIIDWTIMDSWFTNLLDPIIGIATAFIALGIWFFESRIDWRDNLPKKLSVLFLYDDKPCFYAHKASLFHASDARALALSIGAQMANTNFIPYSPYIKIESALEKDSDGQKINHYKVVFTITKPIKPFGAAAPTAPDTENVKIWKSVEGNLVKHITLTQVIADSKDDCAKSIYELMQK